LYASKYDAARFTIKIFVDELSQHPATNSHFIGSAAKVKETPAPREIAQDTVNTKVQASYWQGYQAKQKASRLGTREEGYATLPKNAVKPTQVIACFYRLATTGSIVILETTPSNDGSKCHRLFISYQASVLFLAGLSLDLIELILHRNMVLLAGTGIDAQN
jgi:hypothetical protein